MNMESSWLMNENGPFLKIGFTILAIAIMSKWIFTKKNFKRVYKKIFKIAPKIKQLLETNNTSSTELSKSS